MLFAGDDREDHALLTLPGGPPGVKGDSTGRLQLAGRGAVRAGVFADLVVFDPETIADKATYDELLQHAARIEAVFVV